MPITALPSTTVHAIGSSQVLTDSASVVKELIDNALDGQATAIFVEISANALDIIQVKDNGHGIAPRDRGMLCKRYCTSKIKDLEDLTKIGGQSLGFRGEALASAAEMSGSLVISTRIEGEPTATSIKVKRQSGIESEEKTSHPVGTTVRVVDFLKTIPVRRQTVLKAPTKLLIKCKGLLQAYALARPSIRFSLKVLKAKNDKGNWMYAPKNGATLEAVSMDAAVKVVGKKVAEQSKWIVWSSHKEDQTAIIAAEAAANETYRIEALLPAPACDILSIINMGQFVSVDSRPVSCARGTLKQIISLYKSYLRSNISSSDSQKLVDPFLYMNIICPQGSYDVNVEPAKDDVLFTNSDLFMKVMENFFTGMYGEYKAKEAEDVRSKMSKPKAQGFQLLLARKKPPKITTTQEHGPENGAHDEAALCPASEANNGTVFLQTGMPDPEVPSYDTCPRPLQIMTRDQTSLQTSPASKTLLEDNYALPKGKTARLDQHLWKRGMYADADDDVDHFHLDLDEHNKRSDETELDDDTLHDVTVSNPWAFAKMNAPIRPLRKDLEADAAINTNGQLLTPARQTGEANDASSPRDSINLAKDALTHEHPALKGLRTGVSSTTDLRSSSPEPFPYPLRAWSKRDCNDTTRKAPISDRDRYGSGALDTWVQKSLDSHSSASSHNEIGLLDSDVTTTSHHRDFVSSRTLPTGTPLSDIPDAWPKSSRKPGPRKQQQSSINKPSFSPMNGRERVWFQLEPKGMTKPIRPAQSDNEANALAVDTPIRHESDDDNTVATPPRRVAAVEHVHPDLASIMDYELRKQAALGHRKKYLRQQAAASKALIHTADNEPPYSRPLLTTPHRNRYNKAIAALHSLDEHSAELSPPEQYPVFESGDPRAYLIRAQQRDGLERQTTPAGMSPAKKRRKTAMLPLETVDSDRSTRDLILKLHVTPKNLKSQISQVGGSDEYISSGNIGTAFSAPTIENVRAWEATLRDLVRTTYTREEGEGGAAMNLGLWTVLQAHLEAHT